jgi:hypothetical protein
MFGEHSLNFDLIDHVLFFSLNSEHRLNFVFIDHRLFFLVD